MMNFGRIEDLMYACRINLYWNEGDEFIDLRDAELVSIKDEEITIKDKDGLYWSWNIDDLEAKLHTITEEHCRALREGFAKLRAEGVI